MKHVALVLSLALMASACRTNKDTAASPPPVTPVVAPAPAESSKAPAERERYNPSRTLKHDLLHTRLDVSFNMPQSRLNGKAWLSLRPYFYPQDSLVLDAKGFDLKKVALVKANKEMIPLSYHYDSLQIFIALDRTYTRNDSFVVYVEYTAKPNERRVGGSAAITSDKGLFFIDPNDTDPKKPTQIWTQGETESNSAWFPTMDTPNEKTTQELCITVDKNYVTLSNGVLQFSTNNQDGTRTDCWKQVLPHAPYLVMMAIGEYEIVKDKWRDLDVHYYMEADYAPYARAIFGNTPEMMEFYSKLLGVVYPWDKYHQVIVRDYVSGAMENTGAVIFGEFMNQTSRELLDGDNESIIAHELFHHWFGDLVTTESWANLPLNESFATYGEYLWFEYKYGRDAADAHGLQGLNSYLAESANKQVDMIRYDYVDKEDMFDSHSYAKGGRILHMLRKYVGDDAFFAALKKYLDDYRFSTAEIHDLRLIFEKITGEDLNWFFDQWFLSSGHPELEFRSEYDATKGEVAVQVHQRHEREETPVYRLPMMVDIYAGGKVSRHEIVVDDRSDTFYIKSAVRPDLVNIDAEKMLLAEISESKSAEAFAFQYRNAPLFMDRLQALEGILESGNDSLATELIFEALSDKSDKLRMAAIHQLEKMPVDKSKANNKLKAIAASDSSAPVRASAISYLHSANPKDQSLVELYEKSLLDSSYSVIGAALTAIADIDKGKAFKFIDSQKGQMNPALVGVMATIYSNHGDESHHDFFLSNVYTLSNFARFNYMNNYRKYLAGKPYTVHERALPVVYKVASEEDAWWLRLGGIQTLNDIHSSNENRVKALEKELADALAKGGETASIEGELQSAKLRRDNTLQMLRDLRKNEQDQNLLKLLIY